MAKVNEVLQSALHKQRIAQYHRSAAKKTIVLETTLYKAFVEPFTDVVKSASLSVQDILSTLVFSFDLLTAITPSRMRVAQKRYDARQEKISKKWKPLLDKTRDALKNPDAAVIAMLLSPTRFIATKSLTTIYKNSDNISQFLDTSGLRDLITPASSLDHSINKKTTQHEKGILGKLAGLFYLESISATENIISEQADSDKPSLEVALKQYFKEQGIDKRLEQDAEELLSAQKQFIGDIVADASAKLEFMRAVINADNLKLLSSIMNSSLADSLGSNSGNVTNIAKDIKEEANKMLESDGFKQEVATQLKKKIEDVTEAEQREVAEKIVFLSAKAGIDQKLIKGMKVLKQEVISEIDSIFPEDELKPYLEATKAGIVFLSFINKNKQNIENI